MKLYAETNEYKLFHGSMLDMLEVIEPNSIDSIVTDPPYELNFMNKGWDNSGIAFRKDTWRKCYEVIKPGGYLLAFGGSRTYHRIACAIEDAGFEIRDTIMWLYGSGFPKSMNIGVAIDKSKGVESEIVGEGISGKTAFACDFVTNTAEDGRFAIRQAQNEWSGWGTALKPAYEPIIVARKPVENSVVSNVLKYGVGGINIDGCRVGISGGGQITDIIPDSASKTTSFGCNGKLIELDAGRFPSNVILTYDETDFDEVCGNMPETSNSGGEVTQNDFNKYKGSMMNFSNLKEAPSRIATGYIAPSDSGNACRYFYCAKASKKDRDDGLNKFAEATAGQRTGRKEGSAGINAYAGATGKARNIHPTVKPTELMQYLIRLVSPPGATILDCFNGSGSTGKAVMFENKERGANYKYIGIELTDEYLPIAKARIEYAANDFDISEEVKTADGNHVQISLFDEVENADS